LQLNLPQPAFCQARISVTAGAHDLLAADFNAAMQRLGPFSAAARLAVAVSGGADSMALALLARR
jgi:tRNA(Ile)-lysidine synthase